MQLHACLLLFIITTDQTSASSPPRCGGDIGLDRRPAGLIHLSLPGLSTDPPYRPPTTHQETTPIPLCTWTVSLPPGRLVLLKSGGLDDGSRISLGCVFSEEVQVLASGGGAAVLSGCDGDKATLSWTGAGLTTDAVQLSYFVQEEDTYSSEVHTSPHPEQDLSPRSQSGTSFTRTAPFGLEMVGGTEGGRGHILEGLESTSGPSSSSQDPERLQPTAPLQAGRADRETLPLPEEELNNGADTSGAPHRADRPTPAGESTALSTDSLFQTLNPETVPRNELPPMERSSNTSPGNDKQNSSLPESPSPSPETIRAAGTVLNQHYGAVSGGPEEKASLSWRNQRSTDQLSLDLMSAVTSDPSKSSTENPNRTNTVTEPTTSSSSQDPSRTNPSTPPITHHNPAFSTANALSTDPNSSGNVSSPSSSSDVSSHTVTFESTKKLQITETPETFTSSSSQSLTNSSSPTPHPNPFTEAAHATFLPLFTKAEDLALSFTAPPSMATAEQTSGDVIWTSGVPRNTHTQTSSSLLPDDTPAISQTSAPFHSTSPSLDLSMNSLHATASPAGSSVTFTPSPTSDANTPSKDQTQSVTLFSNAAPHQKPESRTHLPSPFTRITPTQTSPRSRASPTPEAERGDVEMDVGKDGDSWQSSPSITTTQTLMTASTRRLLPWSSSRPRQEDRTDPTTSALSFVPSQSSTTSRTPRFYIVPDEPAAIRVESIELLLQIVVEESQSTFPSGLEEDTAAWVEPYLQRAPGFSRLLGVWSSGHAVQSLVQFKTRGALQWLSVTGPSSLLERTGLTQAVREGRSFRSSKVTNITLGGVQTDVCVWLLQCPAGHQCVSHPGTSNYSCSSVCHFDFCHHHGICTHHPRQPPVCRCLVGEDFWYMGQRCDVRMTRARLVGACLAILLVMVAVIGVLALVVVRRYKAALIQAKVDQTRSSYRRFNHFDELSGRFWLRSWAGSADSLDNPAFTRSDELLHLRALDRPCCYHDDTLSLASTCPSHGTRINTIYPHSSQYGWRGSEVSVGEGVLDSGKASDLSVCSWPVEPIQWTPFPLLQQLASHRTPTVRMSRPRSYCEGMELVDLGKSWTA